MMVEDLERYLIQSSFTWQSVVAVRPRLARWVRFLRSQGVEEIPNLWDRSVGYSWSRSRACNFINMLIDQEIGNQTQGHHLRNLTGIRSFKA
jgi:hypothetical protein